MYGPRAIESTVSFLFWLLIIFIPLGLWKIVDIAFWALTQLSNHLRVLGS